ncbi:MAG: class I SAM-dependent methyltransferase [Candidatus Nezhaarchaeales archaeon]
MSISETFYDFCGLILHLVKGHSIADLGCGLGVWGYAIRCRLRNALLIGIDISLEALKFIKRYHVYDGLLLASCPFIPLRDKSVDTVFCIDVIEHLSKSQGLKLLRNMEKLAKKRIIVTVPTPRIVHQSPEHISVWRAEEFKAYGYKVIGVRFRYHTLTHPIKYMLIWLFELLGHFIPALASIIVAYKDLT